MRLYKTDRGAIVEDHGSLCAIKSIAWDDLVTRDDLVEVLQETLRNAAAPLASLSAEAIRAPIGGQEVWAAGVTYYRSRDARIEESATAGGGDFYDRVYAAERPELFYKASPHRVVGPGESIRIRSDSQWNVPEPELTLLINPSGRITGYTIGNDVSSRDIEGENPLYLPQAKVYDGSCALGPAIFVSNQPLPLQTTIAIEVLRAGRDVFAGSTQLTALKRTPETLVEYLYRESSFPRGCFLMTGTGIVPEKSFTLQSGDRVSITIEPIGTLWNTVE